MSNSGTVESLQYFGYSSVYFVFCSDINIVVNKHTVIIRFYQIYYLYVEQY